MVLILLISCEGQKQKPIVPEIKGMDGGDVFVQYMRMDSIGKRVLTDTYCNSLECKPVTLESISDAAYLYERIHRQTDPSDSANLAMIYNYIDGNYRRIFDTLPFDKQLWLISDISRSFRIPDNLAAEVFDQFEQALNSVDSIKHLPRAWELVELIGNNGPYKDSIRCERIRKTGSDIVMKELLPQLQKVSTLAELDDFRQYGGYDKFFVYFTRGIIDEYNKKEQEIFKKIENNPSIYTLATLKDYSNRRSVTTPTYFAEMVKKAKNYDDCVDLMDNYIPKDTPIWRACDRKAQKLLGLYP